MTEAMSGCQRDQAPRHEVCLAECSPGPLLAPASAENATASGSLHLVSNLVMAAVKEARTLCFASWHRLYPEGPSALAAAGLLPASSVGLSQVFAPPWPWWQKKLPKTRQRPRPHREMPMPETNGSKDKTDEKQLEKRTDEDQDTRLARKRTREALHCSLWLNSHASCSTSRIQWLCRKLFWGPGFVEGILVGILVLTNLIHAPSSVRGALSPPIPCHLPRAPSSPCPETS